MQDEITDAPQPRVQAGNHEPVTALLLAGGSSKRFGQNNKLLALRNDQSLVHHACHHIAASRLQRLIVVLGHEAELIEQHCRDFFSNGNGGSGSGSGKNVEQHKNIEIEFVVNTDYDSGMASSLRTGVSHLLNQNIKSDTEQTQAAMVFLADMPSVKPATINTLIESLETDALKKTSNTDHQPLSAIVPTYQQSRGNPVILMPEWFNLLLDVTGDIGARHLLQANPDAVLEVAVDDAGILKDFDTPEQLRGDPTAQQGANS